MTKVIGPSASRGKLSAAKIALLEKRLRGEFDASIASARITARPAGPAPLSFAQLRLWFLDQLEPGSPTYNIPAGFWLKGSLDVVALERSLNEILQRHEVLRARFPADGGKPIQIIEPEQCLTLAAEPLTDFGVSARQAVAQTLARRGSDTPLQSRERTVDPRSSVPAFRTSNAKRGRFRLSYGGNPAPHRGRCLVHRYSDP